MQKVLYLIVTVTVRVGHVISHNITCTKADEGFKAKKRSQPSKRPNKTKKSAHDDEEDDDDRTTDEGEMESREVDYISNDSSGPSSDEQRNDKDAQPKKQQKKQVGESLVSESSSESSEEELDDSGKAILALMKKQEDNNSSGSDEAEEIDAMDQSQFLPLKSVKDESTNNSSTTAKSSGKREATLDTATAHNDEPVAKKLKLSTSTTTITVDEVKYYLMRKPITATDLAKKFRSKKTGMDKMKVIERLGEIIQKNLNVERKTVQGKTYLSIKAS